MSEILRVEHFGPIREAELELKKTTVLIGPQGSGKSTLAKLVAVMKNSETVMNLIKIGYPRDLSDFDLKNYLQPTSTVEYNSNGIVMNLTGKSIITITSEAKDAPIDSMDWPKSEQSKLGFLPEFVEIQKNRFLKKEDMHHVRISEFQITINKYLTPGFYIPTERFFISTISNSLFGLIYSQIALPKNIVAFGSDFEIARRRQAEYKVDFLNIKYSYENGQDRVYFSDSQSLALSESASGYQSVVPLFVVVEHISKGGKNHFIIEEPELNLYPTTQKDLIYYLANRCTKGGNELVMTTHSPYVLSALNNLLFAFQVAKKFPEKAGEVAKIIPKESWLNPDEFAAYYVGDGTVRSIVNPKTGMISENELDEVSELIGEEFDRLMEIYRTPIHA